MKKGKYQLKDIPVGEVLLQQYKWSINNRKSGGMIRPSEVDYIKDFPYTYEILGKKYGSEKLIFKLMEKLADLGYLEYGVSLRTAWLTDKGLMVLGKIMDKSDFIMTIDKESV